MFPFDKCGFHTFKGFFLIKNPNSPYFNTNFYDITNLAISQICKLKKTLNQSYGEVMSPVTGAFSG
jgi:hypothetical protein